MGSKSSKVAGVEGALKKSNSGTTKTIEELEREIESKKTEYEIKNIALKTTKTTLRSGKEKDMIETQIQDNKAQLRLVIENLKRNIAEIKEKAKQLVQEGKLLVQEEKNAAAEQKQKNRNAKSLQIQQLKVTYGTIIPRKAMSEAYKKLILNIQEGPRAYDNDTIKLLFTENMHNNSTLLSFKLDFS